METLSKLIGRFYIILLYLIAMAGGAMIFGLIGDFVFHPKSKGFIYVGADIGYVLIRPLRNRLAVRYGLKSTHQINKESQAKERVLHANNLIAEACRLEIHGKKEEAIAKYKEVIDKFPELPLVADARKAIELLQSQANQDGKNTLNLW